MSSVLTERVVENVRRHTPAFTADGTIVFLEGVAWDHPSITYAIMADRGVDPLAVTAVRRAIGNWNAAIAGGPAPRLRDFSLVPARECERLDIEIRLSVHGPGINGTTERAREADGSISHVLLTLAGRDLGSELNLGAVVTTAVRHLGRALGLGFAATPDDPMYPTFNGVKLQPSVADVQAFAAVEDWYVVGSPRFYPPGSGARRSA